jgi:hypothetical protein
MRSLLWHLFSASAEVMQYIQFASSKINPWKMQLGSIPWLSTQM